MGFVKLIVDFADIEVKFDLVSLQNRLSDLNLRIQTSKDLECDTEECKIKMDGYREVLSQHEIELSLVVKTSLNKHFRVKRWDTAGSIVKYLTGNLDAEDGRIFNMSIDNLNSDLSQNSADIRNLQENMEELQAKSNYRAEYNPERNEREEKLAKEVFTISDEMGSMLMTILKKKFSGNLKIWEENLKPIFEEKNSTSSFDQELGLSLTESLNTLDVDVQIFSNEVSMVMKVPRVVKEKKSKLLSMLGTPTKAQNIVLYTDFEMSHLVISNDSEIKTIGKLNECIKASDQVYLCQSDTAETLTSICLKNIILFKTIDLGVCADNVFVAKLPDVVMIKNDFGSLWFSSENHKSVEIACKENDKTLSVYGSGSIDLEKCGLKEDKLDDSSSITVFYSNLEKLNVTRTIAPPLLEDSRLYSVSELLQNSVKLSDLSKKFERKNLMTWIFILFAVIVTFFIVLDVYRRRKIIKETVNVTSKKFQRINDALHVITK